MSIRSLFKPHRLAAIALFCLLAASSLRAEVQPVELTIDLNNRGKPFRGWGTSLAWWANEVGNWPEQKVEKIVHLVIDPSEGLGMNVFRYNIGGGDRPGDHHMRPSRAVPGFRASLDQGYDWNSDGAQRRVLIELIKASADRPVLEAFSNSAPWWMTVSGCSSGAVDGGPNLRAEENQAFVDYVAEVVAGYRDRYSIGFNSVELLNEPDAIWWKAGGSQEGMHVGREQQAQLIWLARGALDQRKLNSVAVSGTDANNIDDTLASVRSFDRSTLAALGQVNTHSYAGDKRAELRQAAGEMGKPLWQSESGPQGVEGDEGKQVMTMASRIVRDMNQLRPEVWCMWQVIDQRAWGALHEDELKQTVQIGKEFYMLAAFTRHLRPGDCVIHLDSEQVLASISAQRHEVAIEIVNKGADAKVFALKLSNSGVIADRVAAARTSATENLVSLEAVRVQGNILRYAAPANSITSFSFTYTAEH